MIETTLNVWQLIGVIMLSDFALFILLGLIGSIGRRHEKKEEETTQFAQAEFEKQKKKHASLAKEKTYGIVQIDGDTHKFYTVDSEGNREEGIGFLKNLPPEVIGELADTLRVVKASVEEQAENKE